MKRTLTAVPLMAVVLILCSWLAIPLPIPCTLQTLGLFLCVGLLGIQGGLPAVGVYLCMGLVGLPVFASFQGGLGTVLGPTGGYLMGFLPATLVMGCLMQDTRSPLRMALAMGTGLTVVYAAGSLWYAFGYASHSGGLWSAIVTCVLPCLIPDGVKLAVAIPLILKLRPIIRKKTV